MSGAINKIKNPGMIPLDYENKSCVIYKAGNQIFIQFYRVTRFCSLYIMGDKKDKTSIVLLLICQKVIPFPFCGRNGLHGKLRPPLNVRKALYM